MDSRHTAEDKTAHVARYCESVRAKEAVMRWPRQGTTGRTYHLSQAGVGECLRGLGSAGSLGHDVQPSEIELALFPRNELTTSTLSRMP